MHNNFIDTNKFDVNKAWKIVNFCNNMFFSYHKFNNEEIYDNIKEFLIENKYIDPNSTNEQLKQVILNAYSISYENKINKLLISDQNDAQNKVYEIFNQFKNFPLIQHEIGKIIYKKEIENNNEIFSIKIPFNKKANDILQERLRNFDKYTKFAKTIDFKDNKKSFNKVYNLKYGENIGINEDLTVADIKNNSATKKLNQDGHTYIFDKNEVEELLNIEKKLLIKPTYVLHRVDHIVKTSYYIGKYKNQDILFCERIFYPVDLNSTCSYSFGFFARGKLKDFIFLTRVDYDVDHSHFDKLINGVEPNCEKEYSPYDKFDANLKYNIKYHPFNYSYYNVEQEKLENQQKLQNSGEKIEDPVFVYKSHIHIADQIYSVLFPNRANHADAVIIPNKNVFNKSYQELYDYSKNHNFRDREDICDFFNRTSHETVPDFEHLVKLMKNITKTTSNEKTICKVCDITKGNVNVLNSQKCEDETILYDLSNITQTIKSAYNDYINEKLNEGENIYDN